MISRREKEKNKKGAKARYSPDEIESISVNPAQGRQKRPDSAWGWFVVLNSFLCNMVVDGMQYTFGNFLLPIKDSFHSTVMEASLIGSLLSGFYNFSGKLKQIHFFFYVTFYLSPILCLSSANS